MTESQHRVCRLAEEAAATEKPEAALRILRELHEELVELERARVSAALRSGSSFGTIAAALGISRQAAHRRYRDLVPAAGNEPVPLSSHARRVLHLAREEAAATEAPAVASEHLLLGVLRGGGGVSSALEAEGLTAERARGCVRSMDGTADGPTERTDGASRAVLAQATEIARARHAHYVEADHIALAALDGPDGGALRAIAALGVTRAAVRERLGC